MGLPPAAHGLTAYSAMHIFVFILHRTQTSTFRVKCYPNYRVVKKEFEFLCQSYFFPLCFNFYSLMADYVIIVIGHICLADNSSVLFNPHHHHLPCSRLYFELLGKKLALGRW